jgi:hypothetical protein
MMYCSNYKLFGRYPSSWLIKTRRFGDWNLSPSSGKKHLLCWAQLTGPETDTSSVNWAKQSRCNLPDDGDRFQSAKRRVLINQDDG